MKCRVIYRLFIPIILVFFSINATSQTTQVDRDKSVFRSPFRYVIIHNELDPKISKEDEERRFIEVFLENKSFTQENLVKLFQLVSNRYPKPSLLFINVYTNLDDVQTPEERDQPKISNSPNIENIGNEATYTRSQETEFFYMYFANGKLQKVKIK